MFDDAEGFYGLEEVEGVDVVRDGDTVKFVSITGLCNPSEPFLMFDIRSLLLLPPQMTAMSFKGSMTPLKQLNLEQPKKYPGKRRHPVYQKVQSNSPRQETGTPRSRKRRTLQRSTKPRPTQNSKTMSLLKPAKSRKLMSRMMTWTCQNG
jgi:ATP-dependent RNA helicase DDX24/MAK5